VIVLAIAVACTALVDLEAWAAAMACCATTDYECATVGGPDDCCQSMGHTVGSATAAPPKDAIGLPALTFTVVSAVLVPRLETFERVLTFATFKRPHDPPHLHPVHLLV
jgi:hypothetical protein